MIHRAAAALLCLGALALVACSSDDVTPVGAGPEQYEEPPDFQQNEGKDWKILSPLRTDLVNAPADPDGTVPVTFRFSSRFVRYECEMTLGLQWLPLDGSAELRLDVVKAKPVDTTDLRLDIPMWPAADDRAVVAGRTASMSIEVRFVCPDQDLDFHASHTFRSTYPALDG